MSGNQDKRRGETIEREWLAELSSMTPTRILAWADATFRDSLTMACSFGGVSGMVLLHMAHAENLPIDVFYLETGFLFPQTHETIGDAVARYKIRPRAILPMLSPAEQADKFGDRLWETASDRCCAIRKVEPNERALAGKSAWIAGLRRDQSATRKSVAPIAWDDSFGLYKIAPLWNWTEDDCHDYARANEIILNPLHEFGYTSIGCTHCTRPISEGDDLRAGRWAGSGKTECGLHAKAPGSPA